MNFTSIDFETAKYSRESACAIGLSKYQNGKVAGTYYSLIRPPVLYIRPDFTAIHGLTVDDVKDTPAFADLWESEILPFIDGFPLAAHNAQFDTGVLRAVLEWYDIPVPELRYFCTCNMSRHVWPGLKSHALTSLSAHFGIAYNAHNALDDALTCGKLVLLAAEKSGAGRVEDVIDAAGIRINRL